MDECNIKFEKATLIMGGFCEILTTWTITTYSLLPTPNLYGPLNNNRPGKE
jgi:hypothetical protein